jgi:IS605 OrfB family transposase
MSIAYIVPEKIEISFPPDPGVKKIWRKPTFIEDSLIKDVEKIIDETETLNIHKYSRYWNEHSQDLAIIINNLSVKEKKDEGGPLPYIQKKEEKSWFTIKSRENQNSTAVFSELLENSISENTTSQILHYPINADGKTLQVKSSPKTESKTGKDYKMIQVRFYPTENEEDILLRESKYHRWYYNACKNIFDVEEHMKIIEKSKELKINYIETNKLLKNKKLTKEQIKEIKENLLKIKVKQKENNPKVNWTNLRDELRKYKYTEELEDGKRNCQFVYDKSFKKFPVPFWNDTPKAYSRTIRGAIFNFTANLNSAISNFCNGKIKTFDLSYKTSKDNNEYIHYEDGNFPSFIKQLEGNYCYRKKAKIKIGPHKRRTTISIEELFEMHNTVGCSIIKDKQTNQWSIYIPVERDWFPPSDHRIENQDNVTENGEAIALDPGMRKFQTGFTTEGETLLFGDRAFKRITPLFYKISKLDSKLAKNRKALKDEALPREDILINEEKEEITQNKYKLWSKIKNLIKEMHWKTANYLVKNFQYIFLGDIKIRSCVRKTNAGNEPPAIVKRILNQFCFFQFKQKLEYKCENLGCKLILVNEALTTKSCSSCGNISETVKKSELYCCSKCKVEIDRDENSAKNILIKSMTAIQT